MHEDHRKRVKERFLKDGIENMPDHEVLELLLFFSIPRKDTTLWLMSLSTISVRSTACSRPQPRI